jgi:hypothetical protein
VQFNIALPDYPSKASSRWGLAMKQIEARRLEDDLFEELLARMYDPGEWSMFSHSFLSIMKPAEAIALNFLISERRKYIKKDLTSNGWFYCKVQKMEEELFMDRHTQVDVLKRLRNMGIVYQERHGIPPLRYIWLDLKTLYRLLSVRNGWRKMSDSEGMVPPPFCVKNGEV